MQDNTDQLEVNKALATLKSGGVIAYPTEAVYGLGCDPNDVHAVSKILQIKQRPINKGFILVAANWEQVAPFIGYIDPNLLARVLASWPGPTTWVFPADPQVPHWITGDHNSVALRISDHPMVKAICEQFGSAIISTSCNHSGMPPTRDARTTKMAFKTEIDYIVNGKVGTRANPTQMRDALTGEQIRA